MTGRRTFPPGILSLILFGSWARGDSDAESDRDFCAFVKDIPFNATVELRRDLADSLREPFESVTVYPRRTAQHMAARGSLFMEHLKREGNVLYDPEGFAEDLFGRLEPFQDYARELELYEGLVVDTQETLKATRVLTPFDLHILHSVVRDACILLTHHAGEPAFGRTSAFIKAKLLFPDLPLGRDVSRELAEGHLTYTRRGYSGKPSPRERVAKRIVCSVVSLIRFCEQRVAQ